MFSSKVKRIIAIILIIAMTVTSAGFTTLANSVDPAIRITNETEEMDLTSKYYEEENPNVKEEISEVEVEEDETTFAEELEEATEAEEDESTTLIKEEEDESTTAEDEETTEAEEDETTTKVEEEPTVVEETKEVESSTEEKELKEDETTLVEKSEENESTTLVAEESSDSFSEEETSVENVTNSTSESETSSTDIAKAESDTANVDTATLSDAEENNDVANTISDDEYADIATLSDIVIEYNLASSSEVSEEVNTLSTSSNVLKLNIEIASKSEMNLLGADPLFGAAPSVMWLGTYPEYSLTNNVIKRVPIKWVKLYESGNEALYITEKVIDGHVYNSTNGGITWANSGIRSWLNGNDGFLGSAFTTNQYDTNGIIKSKTITNNLGSNTSDKVFLLSESEANNYFNSNDARKADSTHLVQVRLIHDTIWWLRTTIGSAGESAKYVDEDGSIWYRSMNYERGVRPAIYINLESSLYKSSNNGVTWDLNGSSFSSYSGTWSSMTTYQGGQALPEENNYNIPTGKVFLGTCIRTESGSKVATIIPNDQTGDITLSPLFGDTTNDKYITYDLGEGTCSNWSLLPGTYTPGVAKKLPLTEELLGVITHPSGYVISGWTINNNNTNIYTEIPSTMTGDITLRPVWQPRIIYNLGAGNSWKTTYTPVTFAVRGAVNQLPDLTNYRYLTACVLADYSYKFDHWEINGTPATEIPANNTENVTVTAIWTRGAFEPDGSLFMSMYPQSSTVKEVTDPIKWRIATISYPYAYLYTDKIIDNVSYNAAGGNAVWANSSLRTWLNDETPNGFYGTVFDNPVLNNIIKSRIVLNNAGSSTADKVSLFSNDEVENYITDAGLKGAIGTAYAKNKDNDGGKLAVGTGGRSAYWLRSQGNTTTNAKVVTAAPAVDNTGVIANNKTTGVRPVVCIDVGNPIFLNYTIGGITWNLNGHAYLADSTWAELHNYVQGSKMTLPVSGNFTNGTLLGWAMNGNTDTFVSEIKADQTGDITLDALWASDNSLITFDLDGEHFKADFATPSYYRHGTTKNLPTAANMVVAPGRTFSHWEIEQGGVVINSNTTTIPNTVTGDVKVVAKYNNISYNITWDLYDGASTEAIDLGTWNGAIGDATYTHRIGITNLPTNITAPHGRTFDHWVLKQTEAGGADIVPATSVDPMQLGNVTIKAVYNKVTYNITWDLYDGTSTDAIDKGTWDGAAGATTYTYGTGIANLPTNITVPHGRTFDHWVLKQTEAGGADIDPATNLSATQWGNVTIKAVYNKVTYNITWDLYDGTSTAAIDKGSWNGAAGATTYTYGTGIANLPTNITVPQGRTFDHWVLKQTEAGGADINSATNLSATQWGNVTIKAVYNKISYPITWNIEGATIAAKLMPANHTYGTAIPLPAKSDITPATGRVFDHWLVNGTETTSISATLVGDAIVTLVYKGLTTHKITWDYAKGTNNEWSFDSFVAPENFVEGTPVNFPDASKVKAKNNGKELDYFTVNGAKATRISGNLKTDVTVKAVLKNKTYDVVWDLGAGKLSDSLKFNTYTYGTAKTLPGKSSVIAPEGQELDYWIIRQDGKADVNKATAISATTKEKVTIVAVYKNLSYKITWVTSGATLKTGTLASTYTYGTGLTLPSAGDLNMKAGETFAYWMVNGIEATEISDTQIDPVTVTLVTEKMVKDNSHNITWDYKVGTVDEWSFDNFVAPSTFIEGITVTLPNASKVKAKDGDKAFDYWTVNGVKATEISGKLKKDVTVEAVFKNMTYEVAWDLGGGEIPESSMFTTYTYGTAKTLPGKSSVIAPEGQEFNYWIIRQEGKADVNKATSISATTKGNITIVAVYKNLSYDITWVTNGVTLKTGTFAKTYTYGTGLTLPSAGDLNMPAEETFAYWVVNGVETDRISTTQVDPVTVTLITSKMVKNVHNIAWNYKIGTADEWSFENFVAPDTFIEGITVTLPYASKVKTKSSDKAFDYWTVNGTKTTEISGYTKDVTVEAVLKNKNYEVSWDLGGGSLPESLKFITYTYGTAKTLPEKASVIAPEGQELDYWIIRQEGKADITKATSISASTSGKVTIVAVYKNLSYKITWAMNGATLKTGTLASTYTYGTGLTLPSEDDLNMPAGETFAYWMVNGIKATEINDTQVYPVTVTLITEKMVIDNTHHITWDYAKGTDNEWSFENFVAPDTFIEGITVILPYGSKVKTKNTDKELDYWTVNGVQALEIDATTKTDVKIAAVLKDRGNDYKEVDSISVITNPKVNYNVNDYFNPDGLVIKVNYTDASTENVQYSKDNDDKFAFEPTLNTKLTSDIDAVVIRYRGKTTTLDITVKNGSVSNNNNNNNRGGGSSGGSGGGGSRGAALDGVVGANSVEMAIITPIHLNEYSWTSTSNESGKKFYGIKVLKTSPIARILMSNRDYAKYYKDLDGEYIQLKNGIFSIQTPNQLFNYAFDFNGNMLTGIVAAKEGTKQFVIDEAIGVLVESGSVGENKYYFYDGAGELNGVMWNQPITYNGVEYTFDSTGKIISEKAVTNNETVEGHSKVDSWEFDPLNNSWKYFEVDASGNRTYLKNTAKEINTNCGSSWYIFDENGNMKTGLTEYKGNIYYLQETGANRGAITTGVIVLNGISYTFDSAGCMVSKVSALTGTQH